VAYSKITIDGDVKTNGVLLGLRLVVSMLDFPISDSNTTPWDYCIF